MSQDEELWPSILESVSSRSNSHTKNVVVLGESGTGKTTLVELLRGKGKGRSVDLGLSYEYWDVKDASDEGEQAN
jgi:ABC-type taurine transport system ATPase subunit